MTKLSARGSSRLRSRARWTITRRTIQAQHRFANTLRIAKIINELRAAGHEIADQNLARVSPIMHRHVIPNGTYHFDDDEEPPIMYAAAN
jgi:hypothetical protein